MAQNQAFNCPAPLPVSKCISVRNIITHWLTWFYAMHPNQARLSQHSISGKVQADTLATFRSSILKYVNPSPYLEDTETS